MKGLLDNFGVGKLERGLRKVGVCDMSNAVIKEGKCMTCHFNKSYLYRGQTKFKIRLLWMTQ